uniref:DUF7507 domain-containing protein n=1 Tax=Methanothrix thermoacetophila TaxID=2224 RepID=UPI001585AD68|nr:SdrD B-like domain-containing protein [Methanothrix thermoacetophila]
MKTASLDGTCPGTDPVTAGIGATVTYCYQVQNTGDVKLTDVSLTDDKYGTITLDKTTLEPGETAEGTSTHTVTPSDYPLLKNIATATGKTPIGSTISAVDDCKVNVVCTPLTVSVSPTSGELNCNVNEVELEATVSGGKPDYSYQWYKDNSPITGATGSSYTATGAGSYKVVVTDANGCTGTSDEVPVTSVGSPSVSVGPTSGELNCNVNEVELEATVSGGKPDYSYQWYKDNSPITGATGSSYTATGAGSYKVVVTDANGCTGTSDEVPVTSVGSPSVSVGPTSGELNCNVNEVELEATVSGGKPDYSYQWYKDNSPITGATGSSYTATGAGSYKVVVTDANGCTGTSDEVPVTSVGSPSVSVGPTSGELNCNVNEVELEATVSGGKPDYSYQWYKGDSLINGATGSSYTAREAGIYKVEVTDANGCTGTSNEVTVIRVGSPSVSVSPASGELNCNVNSIELTATVTGGEEPYSYQWYKDDSPITGATGSSYTATGAGSYKVVVTDANGCTGTSDEVPVTSVGSPSVSVGPTSGELNCNVNEVELEATVSGGKPDYSYQWYKGDSLINGATGSSYTAREAGIYKVEVTDANGCTGTSNEVTVIRVGSPSVSVSPASGELNCNVNSIELTATVTGGEEPYSYQWYKDDSPITGATGSSYTATGAGSYKVVVTDANGCTGTSDEVPVTSVGSPSVSVGPTSGELNCNVNEVELEATVSGGKPDYSYQWYKDDSPITGATGSSYTATGAGSYKVVVTDANGCTGTSDEVPVTSVGSPSVSVGPTSGELNCNVNEVELEATVSGGKPDYSYQWYKDNSPITGATGSSYTATGAGSYKVVVTDANGCTGTSDEVPVTSVGSPSVSVGPTSGELNCNVNEVELEATVSGGKPDYSYQWYKGDSLINGATGSSYTAREAGIYKVEVTDANGCTGTSNEVTVIRVGSPSVSVSPASGELNCNVNSIELTATVTGGEEPYSYQWYKDDSPITGATGSSYTATGAGSYKVVVTDANGCTAESSATITEVECITKIIVDKVTDPSGSTESFEFTGSWSGGTTFSLTDGADPYDSGQLEPGEYTVTEIVPDGWDLSSIEIDGDTDGGSTSTTSGSTATIDLDAGETIRVTFTNTLKTGGQGKLDVSGYKFNDLNGNGNWDTGEPGIEGWTIYLSDGTTTISTTTGSDGSYSFTNLPAGKYTITEEERAGWSRTLPADLGSYEINFDGEEDRSVADQNFGNVQTVQPQAKLAITSTPQDPCSNTPVVVTVSCENLQGDLCGSIASMTLYYDSSSVEMTKGSNGRWTATVPGQSAGTTLSVYAVPKDSQGNFIESIGTTATVEITWVDCAIDIEKTADRETVEPGDTITYTLTVKNTGSATINDATVVDTLPPGTLYKSADPEPSGVSGSVVTWNLGALEAGASVVITLTATVESDVCTRQSFTPSDEQNQKRGLAPPVTGEERLTIMAASPVDQELIDSLYRNMTRLEAKLNYVRKYRDTFDKVNASLVISNVTLNGSVYKLMNYTNTTTGDVLTEAYNSSGALAWSLLVRPQKYDSLRTEYVNGRVVSENYITREPWEGLLIEYDRPYPGYTNLTVTYYPTGDTLVVVRDLYGNVISREYKKLPGVPPVPLELENCATVKGRIGEIEVSDSSCAIVTLICPLPVQGKLTLDKRPSVEVASVGQTITYTYTITNGGEITISNIYVYDDRLGRINADPITLDPGDTTEVTATYVVKATDESPIKNIATAKGEDPNGDPVVSDPAEAEVMIASEVLFNKTAEPKVVEPGDTITYTIRYQNRGGTLHDVRIVDYYPNEVYFISATPAPTSGNNVWYIGDLASGESGEIVILVGVAQELGNMSFRMDQSVSGSGYVNVYNNLCTTPPRIVNRAEMVYRLTQNGESTKVTTAAEVQLGPPATCAKIKEHGSGSYETDDLVRYERGNRTITWNKSLSATHYPTSFSLPRNRSLNYTTLWVEKQKAKNYATDASFSEEYTYARDIKRDSSLQMDENGSRLMIDTEFTGMGHVGILKAREGNLTKNALDNAVYESREDYVGSFRLYQKVDEYGEHLRSESEASGTGFASVDKRLGSAQRSYESGTGSYESSQLMDTLSSYMHKEISLEHAPANYTYSQGMGVNYTGKWYEGMWSKTDKSLISESFSSLNTLEKETYARGLNEMETEAEFSGKADFRVLYQDLSGREGRTVDLVDQYIGDYKVNRKVSITGVSRYSYPHISVRKEGSVDLANSTYADYRIIVENDGNVNLGPVYILDIFPPGTEYVGSSARPGELTSEYANWTLLHLGIGDTATISLTLNITEEVSNLVNRVIVSGAHDDEWVTARNFSSIKVDWLECCPAELTATKTAAVHNDTVSYRISLSNRANYTMVAFVIDYIPSDMQLINYSLTPSQIRENRIEWAILDLRPGKRIDIDYNMRALRSGTFTNRARVEAYPIDGPGSVEADLAARAYVGVEIKEREREGWTVPKCMGLNCTESYRDDWMSCSTCAPE